MTATERATLQDVAERAGVSLKTASRAVNDEKYVSDSTRDRVLAAAAELGFHLNTGASLLARGLTSSVVGMVTGDLANPFYASLARGAENELRGHELQLTLSSSDESPESELAIIDELARRHVRAVIVVSTLDDHSAFAALQQRGIPVVFVDRAPHGVDADAIVLANREGGRAAADHLLAAGHRRIAFLGDFDRLPTYRERLEGFADGMRAAGIEGWERWVGGDVPDLDTASALTAELLAGEEPPTALFASNNRATIGALRAIARAGGTPPALIGFDDFDLAEVLGVTVVAHDPVDMGRTAVRAALDRLDDRVRPSELITMPTRVITRGSGERRPPREQRQGE